MLFFFLICFLVERSKVFFFLHHVVVEPLAWVENEECVAVFCIMLVGGRASACRNGRRSTPWRQMRYDYTMGYPGEDV